MRHDEAWGYGRFEGGWGGPPRPTGSAPGRRAGFDPQEREDEELRRAVRQALFEDTWLDARDIRIEARYGVVTLIGEVKSYMELRYAWDDAWSTYGVRGVVSRLEVRETGEPKSS